MKDDRPKAPGALPSDAEPFLARWSRRKAQARQHEDERPPLPDEPAAAARPGTEAGLGTAAGAGPNAGPAAAAPAGAALPDLASLDGDSDYSAFMAKGVDESLRRDALRRLFRSPKFNVLDGLDDYCGDFTRWNGLGDIITADMRHQMERAAKLAEKVLDEAEGSKQPPVTAASAPAAATDESPGDGTEDHERPERPA